MYFSVGALWIILLSLAMLQTSRGNNVWTEYVTQVDFFASAPNAEVPLEQHTGQAMVPTVPQHPYVNQYPQHQYVVSQYPQQNTPQALQPQFVPPQQPQYITQVTQV